MPHFIKPIDVSLTAKQITRFWQLVEKSADGCWEWRGTRLSNGYGVVHFSGTTYRAHRIAWLLLNGEIADGLFICHHCDNPGCVRPDHLFPGTPLDNRNDMKQKDRGPKNTRPRRVTFGEAHHNAILREEQAREIRRRFRRTAPYRTNADELAREFGVNPTTIASIGDRKSWRHLDD